MLTFEFKGYNSKDLGLRIADLNTRQRANQRKNIEPILGRSGNLVTLYDEFDSYSRPIIVDVKSYDKLKLAFDKIIGYGILKTSKDIGGFFYATIENKLDPRRNITRYGYQIDFEVEPFFYLDSGLKIQTITGSTNINNLGNYKSEPILKVFGNGAGKIILNGQGYDITNIESYITIDSSKKEVYKDSQPQGDRFLSNGIYPILNLGLNTISFSGGITKIDITPNWREL